MGLFDGVVGDIIGAGASLLGGSLDNSNARGQWQQEYNAQKEFAQNGIRWKVADAKAAGIHPLFALGAQTASYSPQAVSHTNYAKTLGEMGQNIGRAISAKQTPEERHLSDLQREGLELDNEYKRANIENVRSATASREMDDVFRMARASDYSVNHQQQVPSMPHINARAGQNPVSNNNPYMDPSIPRAGWQHDYMGRKTASIPSDPMAQRTEDKLVIEWIPWIGEFWNNLKAKLFGAENQGHWWHGDDKGYLPYPPKRRPAHNAKNVGRLYYDRRGVR